MEQEPWKWFASQIFTGEEPREEWHHLFVHCFQFGKKSSPTVTWLKEAQKHLEAIELAHFVKILPGFAEYFKEYPEWFKGKASHMLRGLLWFASLSPHAESYRFIRQMTERAYQKVSGKGAFAKQVGNTGLNALVDMETPEAMMALLEMKTRTKYPTFLKAIDQSLQKLSRATSLNEHEIQDQMTPDYGLEDLSLEKEFGDYKAQFYLESYQKTHLEWLKPDGKTQKSDPAVVKRTFDLELRQFKTQIQDVKKTLQSQRYRLEQSWINRRVWAYADFRKYILDHPLLRIISRLLIWQFERGEQVQVGIYQAGKFVNAQGNLLENLEDTQVKLWHPVLGEVNEVLTWRDYIFQKEIRQPFKQAFREVYVVTEAELATETYSNRFSAHILEQNKLFALAQQRNWQYKGSFGYDFDSPETTLLNYNLKVYLDVAFPSWEYASTQRLRFEDLETGQDLALKDIDPVAFSEVMRDVDLFIAVCSIGSDPNWDGSEDYRAYWMEYSFGEKSESVSAKNRREILERIIPKTKIADLCSFEGNFLVVRGQLRSYKINIGSANILMKPDDKYLCIVPDRRAKNQGQKLFLPFDGDSLLTLILSKAFLLAEDDKITDSLIMSQIEGF